MGRPRACGGLLARMAGGARPWIAACKGWPQHRWGLSMWSYWKILVVSVAAGLIMMGSSILVDEVLSSRHTASSTSPRGLVSARSWSCPSIGGRRSTGSRATRGRPLLLPDPRGARCGPRSRAAPPLPSARWARECSMAEPTPWIQPGTPGRRARSPGIQPGTPAWRPRSPGIQPAPGQRQNPPCRPTFSPPSAWRRAGTSPGSPARRPGAGGGAPRPGRPATPPPCRRR